MLGMMHVPCRYFLAPRIAICIIWVSSPAEALSPAALCKGKDRRGGGAEGPRRCASTLPLSTVLRMTDQ
jgi:hypothetical protein